MTKESRFSKVQRGPAYRTAGPKSRRGGPGSRMGRDEPADWNPTPAQILEIERRVTDFDDPVRYLLVSRMVPRFSLYYNVSDDLYAMNDPSGATWFNTPLRRSRPNPGRPSCGILALDPTVRRRHDYPSPRP